MSDSPDHTTIRLPVDPYSDPAPCGASGRPASSFGTVECLSGDTALCVWGSHEAADSEPGGKVQLQLDPDCPVVIGRAEGHYVPYLDPSFRATRVLPGTEQSVMRSGGGDRDVLVSRAHFMLRGDARGIMLTNGVPQPGGGIRPPVNGTWMAGADWRLMDPGEEYLIEHGAAVALYMPNGAVVQIRAL
jgi:hypothetical protein